MTGDDTLLDESTAIPYLVSRGVLSSSDDGARVTVLDGGVSSVVLRVDAATASFVVKQALPRLKVAEEWLAPRERTMTEGRALQVFASLTPDHVPAFVDLDEQRLALTMAAAPVAARPWKSLLMEGACDPGVGETLGRVLAAWHVPLRPEDARAVAFDDADTFRMLRVDPYFEPVMVARPDLEAALRMRLGRMGSRQLSLVHGDFSPKNVMIWPSGCWILDFEVAHFGDPSFDLAFLLHHLVMKAIHRPESRGSYVAVADAFVDAYGSDRGIDDPEHVVALTGALLLARVLGKSRAEYLDHRQASEAEALGSRLLTAPAPVIRGIWTIDTQGAP